MGLTFPISSNQSNQFQSAPIWVKFLWGGFFRKLVKFGFLHYGEIQPPSIGFSFFNQLQSVQSVPISSNLSENFSGDFFSMLVKFGFLHYGQIQSPSMGFSLSNQFQSVQLVPISSNLAEMFCGDFFLHAC